MRDVDTEDADGWDPQQFAFTFYAQAPLWAAQAIHLHRAADILREKSEYAAQCQERIRREREKQNAQCGQPQAISWTDEWAALMVDNGLISVSFMLIGLAMENLAKGLLVRRDQSHGDGDGTWQLKSHDLAQLLGLCGIKVDAREQRILCELSEYVRWRGRYYIPLKATDLPPNGVPRPPSWKDYDTAVVLYNTLLQRFDGATPSNQDSD